MKFQIDKQFDFCYGHRVHNQTLDPVLSDGLCKCRHLHGHNGMLKIGLEADSLERGMVTDFKNLECIKRLVDDVLDHKFIIDITDPLFGELTNGASNGDILWDANDIGIINPVFVDKVCDQLDGALKQATTEKLEGFVVVKFVPTSENLCNMFGRVAQKELDRILGSRIKVSYVDFWETPKSHCHVNF